MSTEAGPSSRSDSEESRSSGSHSLRTSADLPLHMIGCVKIFDTRRFWLGLFDSKQFLSDDETALFFNWESVIKGVDGLS